MKKIQFKVLSLLVIGITLFSCRKFLEIDPPVTQLSPEVVFKNDNAAESAIIGIYSRMVDPGGGFASGSISSFTAVGGLSADEFLRLSNTTGQVEFSENRLLATNSIVSNSLWNPAYQYIYSANAILEGLSKSSGVSEPVKKQLEGEAKFVRGFCYFYLTNLFGNIPLQLGTDYRANNTAVQSKQTEIYAQVAQDLQQAYELLGESYPTSERVRPNKWAAAALLARVSLYQRDWALAEKFATAVIERQAIYKLKSKLEEVFLKNSTEAIWQLMPVRAGYNTNEGAAFIPVNAPVYFNLTSQLNDAFEPGDQRKSTWIKSTIISGKTYLYPYKYRANQSASLSEYSMVLRLAELYLIRAEARAELGKITGNGSAKEDLDAIRQRAGLQGTSSSTKPEIITAIFNERRVELFSEWGHRWLDLKRFNQADEILAPLKGAHWQKTDVFYPIPQAELNANSKIIQNEGY